MHRRAGHGHDLSRPARHSRRVRGGDALVPVTVRAAPRAGLRVDGLGAFRRGSRERRSARAATRARRDGGVRPRVHARLHRSRCDGLGAREDRSPQHERTFEIGSGIVIVAARAVAGRDRDAGAFQPRAPLPPAALEARAVGPARHGNGVRVRVDPLHRAGARRGPHAVGGPGDPRRRGWSCSSRTRSASGSRS